MAEAIIVDDGGSTRIKKVKTTGSAGKLNDLIDVHTDVATGPFTELTITCIDETGTPTLPGGASATTFPLNLGGTGGTFKVISGDHLVEGTIINGTDCLLSVKGQNGADPLIEGKHAKGQHRYVVSNAPPIDKVEVKVAGSTTTKTFTVPAKVQYTAVVLN
jgi:hypothetical protein